jgi:hypothetical protein
MKLKYNYNEDGVIAVGFENGGYCHIKDIAATSGITEIIIADKDSNGLMIYLNKDGTITHLNVTRGTKAEDGMIEVKIKTTELKDVFENIK